MRKFQVGPEITTNAMKSLRQFCDWQYEENINDDSNLTHHDTALLITG